MLKGNIFDLAIIRGLSVLITATAIYLTGSFENFYPIFLTFTLAHVLLAFYFSYARFKNLCTSRQRLSVATFISLIGILITFAIFPSIGLIFIIHEVSSQIFTPIPEKSSLELKKILLDRWSQSLRFFTGFFGLGYIARASDLILFVPTTKWLFIFILGLFLIFIRTCVLNKWRLKNISALLNVFSFEWILFIVALFSHQFQFSYTAAHIAFYHVFFWFFLTLKEAAISEQKGRYKPVWLHVTLLIICCILSPKALSHFGYLSEASYSLMSNYYSNLVLLLVCIHIFSSFYLSKYNPEFFKKIFASDLFPTSEQILKKTKQSLAAD